MSESPPFGSLPATVAGSLTNWPAFIMGVYARVMPYLRHRRRKASSNAPTIGARTCWYSNEKCC